TIREAVDLARQRGARIVGLGAYSSVVTRGGLLLKNPGVPLTTGNSYTVATAVAAITKAARDLNLELNRTTAAVVGATGAVGRATALLLAETAGRLILVGNPAHPEHSRQRLAQVAMAICRHLTGLSRAGYFPKGSLGQAVQQANDRQATSVPAYLAGQGQLLITTDLEAALPACDLVVTATSSPANLITPQHLKFGAVVCDLSKPPNVSPAVSAARPDVLVIDGGIVAVPGKPDFGWHFGFPPGQAYACMAETMILALEQRYTPTSLGTDLNLPTIRYLREAGEKLGFRLAQLRSFEQPLPTTDWERLLAIRSQLYCHQR
ncbi:MAG: aminotransferase III, partial [Heliobacteriaceae bacterium]|nr:aminotransferase III [Heliobacteriaceae bacterium]